MLKKNDIEYLRTQGISASAAEHQINRLCQKPRSVILHGPATIDRGIQRLSVDELGQYRSYFEHHSRKYTWTKFVPASGVASRMFHDLTFSISVRVTKGNGGGKIPAVGPLQTPSFLHAFLEGLKRKKFAFYADLSAKIREAGDSITALLRSGEYATVIEYLLTSTGLHYSATPKALIQFHRYRNYSRTPLEEHIVEGIRTSSDHSDSPRFHFTVAEKHLPRIRTYLLSVIDGYLQRGIDIRLDLSVQKAYTRTLAVTSDGRIARSNEGHVLLRPGGHGALLENLNELETDCVFIKNIDNVVHEAHLVETITFKQVLAGYLMVTREKVFAALHALDSQRLDEEILLNIERLTKDHLNIQLPVNWSELPLKKRKFILRDVLNRPIRVCGMVPNSGEPGGAPFWVKNYGGTLSLQIIEKIQIKHDSPEQIEIFNSSSHFNPVDLVCSITDYKGRRFDLKKFTNPDQYMIGIKNHQGNRLTILEYPGLWNGSMAEWISIFIEIPETTFNPVKTVNDLLKSAHQPGNERSTKKKGEH